MIFLLTGESGSGKTTLLSDLNLILNSSGIKTGGFTAPGNWKDGIRSGFTLHDILHDTDYPLAQTDKPGSEMQGRFAFDTGTLLIGNRLLMEQSEHPFLDFIIVDEVGPFELRGMGWAPSLGRLSGSQKHQIWAVRPSLIDQVKESWKFIPGGVFRVPQDNAATVFRLINEVILQGNDGK